MIGMAVCDWCGARMPLREAFPTEVLVRSALAPSYQPLAGPCTCGGTLREDVTTTLALLRRAVEEDE